MKTISVNLPEAFVNGLEQLCNRGLYANRSEAIRVSVRDLLKRELVDPVPVVLGKVEGPVFDQNINPPPYISFLKIGPQPQKSPRRQEQ
jgi:hypothetical protein